MVILVFFLVAGCTGEIQGVPEPDPGTLVSSTVSGPSNSSHMSPPITAKKLELSSVEQKPCGLIPDSFMRTYGPVVPGQIYPSAEGAFCKYKAGTNIDYPFITVGLNTKSGGLKGLYERRSNFSVFEPGTLRGYPSLRTLDGTDPGICSIGVGVNDTEVLSVYVDITSGRPNYDNPCVVTLPILTEALQRAGG